MTDYICLFNNNNNNSDGAEPLSSIITRKKQNLTFGRGKKANKQNLKNHLCAKTPQLLSNNI